LLAVMLPTPRDTGATALEVVERMEKLFEQGKTGKEIIKALGGRVSRRAPSRSTASAGRRESRQRRASGAAAAELRAADGERRLPPGRA
jgi:hypothetical protein